MCGALRPLLRIFLLIPFLGLAGCGDMPRPFDHTGNAFGQGRSPQLTRLATANAVTVGGISGLPDTEADAVAAAMVEALGQQETPARIGIGDGGVAGDPGYRMTATLQGDTLLWTLMEPAGSVIATYPHQWPGVPVETAAKALVPVLDADRERPLEVRMRTGGGPAPVVGGAEVRPVRVVMDTAAASQGIVLRNAMESALRKGRLILTRETAVTAVEVRGQLVLGAPWTADGAEPMVPVSVTWVVVDPAGKEIGTARQENPVPKRLIDGSFPMLAVAIAQAGADGIVDVLDRVPGIARSAGSSAN